MNARNLLPAVALLLLAFTLRVYQLDAQDIWGDEAMSIAVATRPLRQTLFMETNPPAYFWLLKLAQTMWGSSPFAYRYLSTLAGVLAVALIGRWSRTPQASRLRPLLALLLAATSPFFIFYAQEARMYALLQLAATASLLLFAQIVRRQRRGRPIAPSLWLAYLLFSLLALFSHFYALALLLAQAVALLPLLALRRSRLLEVWAALFALQAALFLPYFWLHRRIWNTQTALRSAEWTFGRLLAIARQALSAFAVGVTADPREQLLAGLLLLPAAVGVIWLWRRERANVMLLLLVLGCGLLFAWLVTPLLPFFWPRYLIGAAAPLLLLAAAGLDWLWRRQAALAALWLLLLLLLPLPSLANYYFDDAYAKGGYGQATRLIGERAGDGDRVLLNGPLQQFLWEYYQPPQLSGAIVARDRLFEDADAYLAQQVAGAQRVWLIESGNPAEYDPQGQVRAWLAQNGSFALHRDYPGVAVDLFVMAAPDGVQQPLNAQFGNGIELLGYAVQSAATAGDTLLLTLFWQTLQPQRDNYTVFVHILNAQGELVAQVDRQPQGGSRPTSSWHAGETIADSYAIALPAELTGTLQLQTGLYLWPDLARLALAGGGDTVTLTTLTVERD